MIDENRGLRPDEIAAKKLRRLLETRGYRRVVVGRFEEYALYTENKNFLETESIITFMNPDGRLLALKPDVTLSVVKNCPESPLSAAQKLYYVDEVCRLSRETREYKILGQFGVELMGPNDAFSGMEIVDLALQSLALLGDEYVLDLSHLGFVSAMLKHLQLDGAARSGALRALQAKSPHNMAVALQQTAISPQDRERLLLLCKLHGSMRDMLPKARQLVLCESMGEALDELESLCAALGDEMVEKHLNLDFSVVNDVDYYNGLIFRGYLQGIPTVLLSGGRYDNLMGKMGKQSGALGFAVYITELNNYPLKLSEPDYAFDLLVTYREEDDYAALLRICRELAEQGKTVRLEREGACLRQAGSWRKRCQMAGSTLEEVAEC